MLPAPQTGGTLYMHTQIPCARREVNAEGLEGLYEILLDTAKMEWAAALQVR